MSLSLLSILRGGPEVGGLDFVVCDGFGDSFWPERWTDEERDSKRSVGQAKQRIKGGNDIGLKDVLSVLGDLRREFGAVVVLSTQVLNVCLSLFRYADEEQMSAAIVHPTPHLPAPFPYPFNPDPTSYFRHPLNIHITLTGKIRPLQFPADTTLVDALRAFEMQSSDPGARYEGIVRIPGGKGLAGTVGGERFGFAIGDSGVEPYTS